MLLHLYINHTAAVLPLKEVCRAHTSTLDFCPAPPIPSPSSCWYWHHWPILGTGAKLKIAAALLRNNPALTISATVHSTWLGDTKTFFSFPPISPRNGNRERIMARNGDMRYRGSCAELGGFTKNHYLFSLPLTPHPFPNQSNQTLGWFSNENPGLVKCNCLNKSLFRVFYHYYHFV